MADSGRGIRSLAATSYRAGAADPRQIVLARWARRSSVWSEPPEGRSHGRIDRQYTLARRSGSLGGKLVGAGEAVSCRCAVRARRARGGRWWPPGASKLTFDCEFGGAYASRYA